MPILVSRFAIHDLAAAVMCLCDAAVRALAFFARYSKVVDELKQDLFVGRRIAQEISSRLLCVADDATICMAFATGHHDTAIAFGFLAGYPLACLRQFVCKNLLGEAIGSLRTHAKMQNIVWRQPRCTTGIRTMLMRSRIYRLSDTRQAHVGFMHAGNGLVCIAL